MQRLINRRQQGDLGEASAIEWLTRQGATASVPLGHSPDYDLIAEVEEQLLRVQVKTSVCGEIAPARRSRWAVGIGTNGGNQSWNRLTKRFDAAKVEALFVLVGDGRRWFIPSAAVDGTTMLRLGGPKYAEFEIESTGPIIPLVYGEPSALKSKTAQGEYRSGQPGCAVNAVAKSFAGSNPASPMMFCERTAGLGQEGALAGSPHRSHGHHDEPGDAEQAPHLVEPRPAVE